MVNLNFKFCSLCFYLNSILLQFVFENSLCTDSVPSFFIASLVGNIARCEEELQKD